MNNRLADLGLELEEESEGLEELAEPVENRDKFVFYPDVETILRDVRRIHHNIDRLKDWLWEQNDLLHDFPEHLELIEVTKRSIYRTKNRMGLLLK